MAADSIMRELEILRNEGHDLEVTEDESWVNVVFHRHSLPRGYNKSATELLIKLPLSFPNGRPDMFWTDPDLLLEDGRIPNKADQLETHLGKQWRRFSYHPSNWNPGSDNFLTYLEFVNSGLQKARQS